MEHTQVWMEANADDYAEFMVACAEDSEAQISEEGGDE